MVGVVLVTHQVCIERWDRVPGMKTAGTGGTPNAAVSLAACQSSCVNVPACTAVDWNPSAATGMKCTQHTASGTATADANVDHYTLQRPTATCPSRKQTRLSLGSSFSRYVHDIIIYDNDCADQCTLNCVRSKAVHLVSKVT